MFLFMLIGGIVSLIGAIALIVIAVIVSTAGIDLSMYANQASPLREAYPMPSGKRSQTPLPSPCSPCRSSSRFCRLSFMSPAS